MIVTEGKSAKMMIRHIVNSTSSAAAAANTGKLSFEYRHIQEKAPKNFANSFAGVIPRWPAAYIRSGPVYSTLAQNGVYSVGS